MNTELYNALQQAKQDGRQPLCPECQQPLVVEETHYEVLVWRWDAQARCYRKGVLDAGTERPGCLNCVAEFPIFMGSSRLLCDLGLDY